MELGLKCNEFIREYYARLGEPFYLYLPDMLELLWRAFSESAPKNCKIHYAIMANDHPEILARMRDFGAGIFVGSWSHLDLVHHMGFKKEEIVAGVTNTSVSELRVLMSQCGTVILGSEAEIEAARSIQADVVLLVRAKVAEPDISKGPVRALGIAPNVLRARWAEWRRRDGRLQGIHSYSGTNLQKLQVLASRSNACLRLASELPGVRIVDIGGGFPAPRNSLDGRAELTGFWQSVESGIADDVMLWTEPGRFLVASAAYFLLGVTSVEQRSGVRHVGTNGSITLFPRRFFFGAADWEHPITVISDRDDPGLSTPALVVGNSTFSRDVLFDGHLPEIREGDVLVFHNAGAYCRSATPRFLGTQIAKEIFLPGLVAQELYESLAATG